ncbi:MAG: hypothetical protein ABW220_01265, partial [Burkholderiaceae bacterium]
MYDFGVPHPYDPYRPADVDVSRDVLAGDDVKQRKCKSFLSFIKRHDNKKIAASAPPTKSCHDKLAEKAQRHEARNPLKKFFHRFTAEHRLKQEQKKRPLTRLLAGIEQRDAARATQPLLPTHAMTAANVRVPREELRSVPTPSLQAPAKQPAAATLESHDRKIATLQKGEILQAPDLPALSAERVRSRNPFARFFKTGKSEMGTAAQKVAAGIKQMGGNTPAQIARRNAKLQAEVDRDYPLPPPGTDIVNTMYMRSKRAGVLASKFGVERIGQGSTQLWKIKDHQGPAFEFQPFPEDPSEASIVIRSEMMRKVVAYRMGEHIGPRVDMKMGFPHATLAVVDGRAGVLSDVPAVDVDDKLVQDGRVEKMTEQQIQKLLLSNLVLGRHDVDWSTIHVKKNG